MGLSQSSSVTMGTKQWVDDTIKSAPVVVFSKSYCPYCKMAKEALRSAIGAQFDDKSKVFVVEIENKPNCGEIQDCLKSVTGSRTVPQVFINGKYIGGGTETKAALQSGELEKMLKEAGVL